MSSATLSRDARHLALPQVGADGQRRIAAGSVLLIGVGGIMSGTDAVARIKAGADLIQSYTGIAYRGVDLIQEVNAALLTAMEAAGVDTPSALKGIA